MTPNRVCFGKESLPADLCPEGGVGATARAAILERGVSVTSEENRRAGPLAMSIDAAKAASFIRPPNGQRFTRKTQPGAPRAERRAA